MTGLLLPSLDDSAFFDLSLCDDDSPFPLVNMREIITFLTRHCLEKRPEIVRIFEAGFGSLLSPLLHFVEKVTQTRELPHDALVP